jgi:RNA polymerase sigma-70 factor (ECF subfamily)
VIVHSHCFIRIWPAAGIHTYSRLVHFSAVFIQKITWQTQGSELTMEELDLIDLVRGAQAGGRDEFNDIVTQFEPVVFAIVLRRLRNRAEASEVTQDVFIQVLRKLPQLREVERFSGWLKQIAVRMAINRAVRRPNEITQGPESFNGEVATCANPLDNLMRVEEVGQLRIGLDRLRELDRQTLIAFYIEGQSLKQMSDEFTCPIGTIKRRLHTARNRLRDELVGLQTVG